MRDGGGVEGRAQHTVGTAFAIWATASEVMAGVRGQQQLALVVCGLGFARPTGWAEGLDRSFLERRPLRNVVARGETRSGRQLAPIEV